MTVRSWTLTFGFSLKICNILVFATILQNIFSKKQLQRFDLSVYKACFSLLLEIVLLDSLLLLQLLFDPGGIYHLFLWINQRATCIMDN